MRFLLQPQFHEEMLRLTDHTPDCYVRPGEYLHHLYLDGIKFVVAPALVPCLQEAQARNDADALRHLQLHQDQLTSLLSETAADGKAAEMPWIGDALPDEEESEPARPPAEKFIPPPPKTVEETGLSLPFLFDLVLRTIHNRGRLTGAELAGELMLPFNVLAPVLPAMRKQQLIDHVGQKPGVGDAGIEYEIKPPKGAAAVEDALKKTEYVGPAPVPFEMYVAAIKAQTIKSMVVTRRTIRQAFADLIITDAVLNEIGPAINSAASIFLFGYPGNGKTSVAERITRLMGDALYIPYAVVANSQIIKLFDPIVHQMQAAEVDAEPAGTMYALLKGSSWDRRFIRIKRPTIVVGGELTMPMLDLKYNQYGKFYEAPMHMKANGGIFMIDDFGRQQVRPMDLLNRWIVPLEKKYDYLTTVTGIKIEIPFDQLLIFSTNLDPNQLADEAFLRRIKFKIEIRDPDEAQWRQIWQLLCKARKVAYDDRAIDYLIEKWYRPMKRPFRMCQPRDILEQMTSIAKYNMERVTLSPDLLDAGCATYFVSQEKKEFGAKVRLD